MKTFPSIVQIDIIFGANFSHEINKLDFQVALTLG